MTRYLLIPLFLAFGLALSACAPAGEAGQGSARGPLTSADIEAAAITGSALDAVTRLRPAWLRSRTGQGIRVYIDGSRAGNTSSVLAGVAAHDVGRIEKLSASEATSRYGTVRGGHPEGAIVVTTRR